MAHSTSVWQRFQKYAPRGSASDQCWYWSGSRDAHGYGQLSDKPNRTVLKAHRLAFEQANGAIDPALEVRHTCDHPACVNPAHLVQGTHAQNMKDMRDRGRWSRPPVLRGERANLARLTADIVLEVRRSRETGRVWAERLDVAESTISAIRRGRTWAHL